MIARYDQVLSLKCSLQRLMEQRDEVEKRYDPQLVVISNNHSYLIGDVKELE